MLKPPASSQVDFENQTKLVIEEQNEENQQSPTNIFTPIQASNAKVLLSRTPGFQMSQHPGESPILQAKRDYNFKDFTRMNEPLRTSNQSTLQAQNQVNYSNGNTGNGPSITIPSPNIRESELNLQRKLYRLEA